MNNSGNMIIPGITLGLILRLKEQCSEDEKVILLKGTMPIIVRKNWVDKVVDSIKRSLS